MNYQATELVHSYSTGLGIQVHNVPYTVNTGRVYIPGSPESLSETPERLSETKTRSGSLAAAAKKRAAEVLTYCTNS